MSNQALSEYLVAIVCKYQKATNREKSQILDHAQDVTGLERKHLIKWIRWLTDEIRICKS
jgi:hypothetical protein